MKFKRRKLFIKSIRDEIVGARCPRCGAAADGGTCVDDVEAAHMPKAGDLGICLYCGAFNKYQADLTQREMTSEELRDLEDDPAHGRSLRNRRPDHSRLEKAVSQMTVVREACGWLCGRYPHPRTWVCASCGVEYAPGGHDYARCSWQHEQEEFYAAGREERFHNYSTGDHSGGPPGTGTTG